MGAPVASSFCVPTELACSLGLIDAIVLHRIRTLVADGCAATCQLDGEKWVLLTIEEWHEYQFPWLAARTIRRVMKSLEDRGLIETCQPEGIMSRRKWYRPLTPKEAALPRQEAA